MKIAFQEIAKWEDTPHAERELAIRMLKAAKSIENVEAIASSDMDEIASFRPAIVIPLHFFVPKLFDAFTVGCMWNPTNTLNRNNAWDNVKSYDGYGVASDIQEQLIRALKFKSPSPYLLTKLYPSTNTTSFQKLGNFRNPVYIGSGWSKGRHDSIFSKAKNISVYGPTNSWEHLAEGIYKGEIPFDGKSSLETYHQAGIGLSLHDENHNLEGIPSMRPFEIAASSAVMISDQNAFVQSVFTENALYIDTTLQAEEIVEQLDDLINWIKSNPVRSQEMAEACHKIFVEEYSLEILLKKLIQDIARFTSTNSSTSENEHAEVEIIVRTDGQDKNKLHRALKSIESQSYEVTSALLMYRGPEDTLPVLQKKIEEKSPKLRIKYIRTNEGHDRGTQLYAGVRASTASYIGFLDHDDVLFSDHVSVLLDSLSKYPEAPLAYSGSIRIWEGGNPPDDEQIRKLAYFYELDRSSEFRSCITSNSFIARRESIPWNVLNQPIPKMDSRDDYIFLNMIYRTNPNFLFSEKVTAAFYWRTTRMDNSAFEITPNSIRIKPFGSIIRQANTRIDYGESSEISTPETSHLIISGFVRKIITILRNDVSVIIARLKGNYK